MMVIAIGPQNRLRASGIMPRMAASAVSTTGRARRTVASMMARWRAWPAAMSWSIWSTRMTVLRMIMPASAIMPSSATKPNGRLEMSNAPVAPMMPSGAVANTSASREKLCSWIIRIASIGDCHDRENDGERRIRLHALLDRAARLDAVAVWQRVHDRLQLRLYLVADVRRLHAVDDVAAHGEHEIAIAPPQDRLLVLEVEPRDLRQRHGDAVAGRDRQAGQTVEVEPLVRHGACHHVDGLDAFAILRHGEAGQQRLQRLRDVLRGQTDGAGAVLIDFQPDRLRLLVPVEMRIDELAIVRHHLADLLGDVAHLQRVGPDDAELHRVADGRTEREPVDAGARFGKRAVGKRLFEARLDALARLQVLGHDDDLGKVRVGQNRVEPEPEARRALSYVARIGHDVGITDEHALGLLRSRVGDADRGAFRQSHFEEQLGAGRSREELLLHQTEGSNRDGEHGYGRGDDALAPAQADFDHPSQRAIDASVVD